MAFTQQSHGGEKQRNPPPLPPPPEKMPFKLESETIHSLYKLGEGKELTH